MGGAIATSPIFTMAHNIVVGAMVARAVVAAHAVGFLFYFIFLGVVLCVCISCLCVIVFEFFVFVCKKTVFFFSLFFCVWLRKKTGGNYFVCSKEKLDLIVGLVKHSSKLELHIGPT